MNSTQLYKNLAKQSGITNKQAKLVVNSIINLIIYELNQNSNFTIPKICKIIKITKPAKPEKKMNCPLVKKEITIKAKPIRCVVKFKASKYLKDVIN
jgi:nucleoid DNA-binding protein